jgi:ABC-type lipoprotein export system ATPase subunit
LEPMGLSMGAMEARAGDLLERMGLGPQKAQRVHELSGGERQRVALARALVHGPKWVFLDEPTASLDAGNRDRMLSLIRDYRDEGVSFIMASHDEAVAAASDRVLSLTQNASTMVET